MDYVYLDLNMWINLHKMDEDDEVRRRIEEAVENEEIAIPLIDTLFYEEGKNNSEVLKQDQFEYMRDLSDYHTLRNYYGVHEFEIERYVYGMAGDYDYDLEEKVQGRGVDHIFGDWTLTIDGVDAIENDLIDDHVVNKLERLLRERPGFDVALEANEQLHEDEDYQWEEDLFEEVQERNETLDEAFNDNKRRRRYMHFQHYQETIQQDLSQKFLEEMVKWDPSVYDFEKYVNQGDEFVETLLQLFPSHYTYVTLKNARDLQDGGKPNDIYDIISLAVAIPYSNAVATETIWKTTAERQNLNQLYGTDVFDSLEALVSEYGF